MTIELEKDPLFTTLIDKLNGLLAQTSLQVTKYQTKQLVAYVILLNKWNKAYNLTSVRDPIEMVVKHIIDSLVVSPHLQGSRFIDVGTGPGLPGIPLAIINPEKNFTLLDSLGKRIIFIKQVIHNLKLDNVYPIQSRVEEFQPEELFDGVISRAFASINDMCDWCQHLPKQKDGLFIALKGQLPENELNELSNKFKLVDVKQLVIPELTGDRHLILLANQ